MSVGLIYHDDLLKHETGEDHPESPRRLRAIMSALDQAGLLSRMSRIPFSPARPEQLHCVHEPAYVDLVKWACKNTGYIGSMDTKICAASYDVALLAIGGVLAACDAVMNREVTRAFCAVRPPGHHAQRDVAGGFCLFNNVAIAADALIRTHQLSRVAIVDFDVHHGNGTQSIFYDRDDVLYISLHAHPKVHYPGTGWAHETGTGRGEGFTLNIPLPLDAGDDDYRVAMDEKVLPKLRDYQPMFLLLSAGFDAVAEDGMAQTKLTSDSFGWMTGKLVNVADEFCGGRVVSVLEGGYQPQALGQSVVAHVSELP